jgi:crotonobetainyl-CoA:carnitine CoA-transferase CaiB-like acyl-CoA transferase
MSPSADNLAHTATDATGAASQRGPLHGLVVADFSRILAGPYATMLMADMGAEVIKVESRDGDDTRHWVPPARDGVATYYLAINRNKRSIALDLKNPGDLDVAHALSERADIFIQNFKPGGLARFGLDYDSVAARNPRSIYCSISGFGTAGGKDLPGYDLLVQAVSGLMSLTGAPDGPPYRAGISVFDVMTGLHSVIGILAALRHLDETGHGQHVETNLLSSAMSSLVNQTSAYVAGDVVPHRMGNAHLSLFPYEPLKTGDGDLIVIAGNDRQFRRLVDELGAPELAEDERFATVGKRNENREELRPLLLNLLAARSAAEWFDRLTAAGIACGPINDVRGGIALADRLGLEPVVVIDGIPTVRHPIRFSRTPARYDVAPPGIDADGEDIRTWLHNSNNQPLKPSARTTSERRSA